MAKQTKAGKSAADDKQAYEKERRAFRFLTLSNPNYFGNLGKSAQKPVLSIIGNTSYERLVCLGYHPQQRRLEGVVHIFQPSGYGSDICGPGTPEYVRFYLSFDNGATWVDQGLTSFAAHNIPEGTARGRHLEYGVQIEANPPRRFCFGNLIARARAILSWNNPPPPNQPNWNPVWGNRLEVPVQIQPRFLFPIGDLVAAAKIDLKPDLLKAIGPQAEVQTKQEALDVSELAKLYGDKVPAHRFAFKELKSFAMQPTALSAEDFLQANPALQINPDILDLILNPGDGNTDYEELRCVGLDPNLPDTLIAIIQVKRASGYSGGPCTDGSREYVTFWGDFDGNGSFETCFGTAEVRVYDLPNFPNEGVFYAVRLPVDLVEYRQRCQNGAKLVRIRAILSWNAPVPCATPNATPTWGNREETLVAIGPGIMAPGGKIAILGGIPVSKIQNITGVTTPDAFFAFNNLAPDPYGRPCPFGARVNVIGVPIAGYSYKVEVREIGTTTWVPLVADLKLVDINGNLVTNVVDPVTLRYPYLATNQNVINLLALWDSAGDALWEVRLQVFDGSGNPSGPPDIHRIQLDNTAPEASIEITTGTGDCGRFEVGSTITGNFVATDQWLRNWSLTVEPAVNDPGEGIPSPSSGLVNTAPSPGDSWTLDTTGMRPCGYIIRVVATDRAILNSASVGHHSPDSAGFCLIE